MNKKNVSYWHCAKCSGKSDAPVRVAGELMCERCYRTKVANNRKELFAQWERTLEQHPPEEGEDMNTAAGRAAYCRRILAKSGFGKLALRKCG